MSKSKIRQLEYESDTWKRQIAFMADENIHMKARLVEILRARELIPSLVVAEAFQNEFIGQDSVMVILKNSIAKFDRLLKREIYEDGMLINAVFAKHKHLEHDLFIARMKFDDLKNRFNKHILEDR